MCVYISKSETLKGITRFPGESLFPYQLKCNKLLFRLFSSTLPLSISGNVYYENTFLVFR